VLNPDSGKPSPWDWQKSGAVELNCFLCHIPDPDNARRVAALEAGEFRWASTATLARTGAVERVRGGWQWVPEAFDGAGDLRPSVVRIQDPEDGNCGLCHGLVHVDEATPVVTTGCRPEHWTTETTGQIISPQRMHESGLNLAGKDTLFRSWDVHAERLVKCTSCHYARNNPVHRRVDPEDRPSHLIFDARRVGIGEYLRRPDHRLSRSPRGAQARNRGGGAREGCRACHDEGNAHAWLPYRERHMATLGCGACHVPRMHAPARKAFDWTVVTPSGDPRIECRGVGGPPVTFRSLVTGFDPVLLRETTQAGPGKLRPCNLVSSWYWVVGKPERPARHRDLAAAFLEGDAYHPDVVAALDGDGDGEVTGAELVLDTEEKVSAVRQRLVSLGLENPRIQAETQPFGISHTLAAGEWALRDCGACHGSQSRVSRQTVLAERVPGSVLPSLAPGSRMELVGPVVVDRNGKAIHRSHTEALYVLGHHSVPWVSLVGGLVMAGTLAAVGLHAASRWRSGSRKPAQPVERQRVIMYSGYERAWHWVQALGILGLAVTGIEIHWPSAVCVVGFEAAVGAHNLLGAVLIANAALAAFYHFASGEIRQYVPEPGGFFTQALRQARYYLRGIFAGEPHPFQKRPDRKLNPLQQITYLAILNVLLPLQVLTGIMVWGAQRWPGLSEAAGGLRVLCGLHTLVAWLFGAFLIAHIYLTTTGRTPAANLRAMLVGWEAVPCGSEERGGPDGKG